MRKGNSETFEEAVAQVVDAIKNTKDSNLFLLDDQEILIEVHHTYGRSIRNEWGLWSGSKLKTELENMGLKHPDDMSSVLILCGIRDFRNKPRNLEEQIQHYKDYWTRKENENIVKDIIT